MGLFTPKLGLFFWGMTLILIVVAIIALVYIILKK